MDSQYQDQNNELIKIIFYKQNRMLERPIELMEK